jgi:hypothetical protein
MSYWVTYRLEDRFYPEDVGNRVLRNVFFFRSTKLRGVISQKTVTVATTAGPIFHAKYVSVLTRCGGAWQRQSMRSRSD